MNKHIYTMNTRISEFLGHSFSGIHVCCNTLANNSKSCKKIFYLMLKTRLRSSEPTGFKLEKGHLFSNLLTNIFEYLLGAKEHSRF